MPPCGAQWEHGSAIVLTHYAERNSGQTGYEPDRVTFCEWFSNEVVADAIIGAVLTTERSIYTSRAKMIDFEDGNADVDMAAWRAWRNVELGGGSNLPDIVWSLGFDTFLTLVVCQHNPIFQDSHCANFCAALARTLFCRWFQGDDRWGDSCRRGYRSSILIRHYGSRR